MPFDEPHIPANDKLMSQLADSAYYDNLEAWFNPKVPFPNRSGLLQSG